ncbi:MAG: divergent PAP2 family protein [Patescibacteria group bacterium]
MEWLQNYAVFLVPIFVGLLIQAIKFIIFSVRHGWKPEYIFTHGHMPSAHTAFAVALLTSIGYYEGIHSGAFAVTVGLAFLIVDDAVRIRMYLGDQGRYLNMLAEQLDLDKARFPRQKERVGHRTNEVLVGAALGFGFTLALIMLLAR